MLLKNGKAIAVVREKDTDENPDRSIRVEIENSNGTIYLKPQGYGDSCSCDDEGIPIMLELWQGELRVVVWGDINQEDPTAIVPLEKAKETERVEQ